MRDDRLKELIDREAKQAADGQIAYANCAREMTVEERLAKIFTYHDDPRKVPNYTAIRSAARHFAEVIMQNSPVSADQSTALRCVREACLWANAAIALDGENL